MKRLAFYGGSFDPVHNGHMAVARALLEQFELDEFYFVPAFHAPHKRRSQPTSAYDRHAMLCLATQSEPNIAISKMEIEMPERPFSVETLERLNEQFPDDEIFFVMGADSWMEITAWREWEKVLVLSNHIVVTRPGVALDLEHVTRDLRKKIVDLRGNTRLTTDHERSIFITDVVNVNVSATEIRRKIRGGDPAWAVDVPAEVAKYVEKYQIYK